MNAIKLSRFIRHDEQADPAPTCSVAEGLSLARVMRSKVDPVALPAPGSAEAKTMFCAACTETDRLDHEAVLG